MIADRNDALRRPTIYDVAERAGVSKSLVSLVLGGSPKVSEKRRAAVLVAITELGYQPSQAATMLASTRTTGIEVLIDEYRNLSFVGLVQGIRDALAAHDFYLTVTETGHHSPAAVGGPRSFSPADGRILAAEPTPDVLVGWSRCPTVVAGHRLSIPAGADVAASDDHLGAGVACAHLLRLGHRHLGHLTGSGGAARLRREGFVRAVAGAGLDVLVEGSDSGTSEQDGYRAASAILTRNPETTALVAANDLMALGALTAIRDHGRSVPGDMSIVGYDNSPLAQSRYLDMTTVDDRSTEVGAAAARLLLARMSDPLIDPVHTLIEPTLVVRGTTGRA